MITPTYEELNKALVPLSLAAGALILDIYRQDFEVIEKNDDSPVTVADQRAEALILSFLNQTWPEIPVVAEEQCAAGKVPDGGRLFFLVDPLDGTKEFIKRRDEFTVNIALVENGVPVYGLVLAPALGHLYVSLAKDRAGFAEVLVEADQESAPLPMFRDMRVRNWPERPAAVISRSHIDDQTLDFLDKNSVPERVSSGSSLKFCVVADGRADVYPRFGPTMEWDTAAGHGVLNAAGGVVVQPDGSPFLYGKVGDGYLNGGFIAAPRAALAGLQLIEAG